MSAATIPSRNLMSMPAAAVSGGVSAPGGECPPECTELVIGERLWEPVSYLRNLPVQLHAKVVVDGCAMHFEAYLVGEDGEIFDLQQKRAIDCLKSALRDDQPWQTIRYQNRRYVVVAIPYGCGF